MARSKRRPGPFEACRRDRFRIRGQRSRRLSLCTVGKHWKLHHQRATFAFAAVHGFVITDISFWTMDNWFTSTRKIHKTEIQKKGSLSVLVVEATSISNYFKSHYISLDTTINDSERKLSQAHLCLPHTRSVECRFH